MVCFSPSPQPSPSREREPVTFATISPRKWAPIRSQDVIRLLINLTPVHPSDRGLIQLDPGQIATLGVAENTHRALENAESWSMRLAGSQQNLRIVGAGLIAFTKIGIGQHGVVDDKPVVGKQSAIQFEQVEITGADRATGATSAGFIHRQQHGAANDQGFAADLRIVRQMLNAAGRGGNLAIIVRATGMRAP